MNDLSKGWYLINRLIKEPFEVKLEKTKKAIKDSIGNSKNPVVCWSGGKDSTVLLHMVRKEKPDIPVIFIDTGVLFPETLDFVEQIEKEWGLNIQRGEPKIGEDFWSITNKYGWPVLGKFISTNVGRAVRTGNIRKQLNEKEKKLALNGIRLSCKCSYYINLKPSICLEKKLESEFKFLGLRVLESRGRGKLWIDYGETYFVKHYFGRNKGVWKSSPLSLWTEEDILRYHKEEGLPHNSLYDKGYKRSGCWTCAMSWRYGQLKRLREYDKNKFYGLLIGSNLGIILLHIKSLLNSDFREFSISKNTVIELLKEDEKAFDNI